MTREEREKKLREEIRRRAFALREKSGTSMQAARADAEVEVMAEVRRATTCRILGARLQEISGALEAVRWALADGLSDEAAEWLEGTSAECSRRSISAVSEALSLDPLRGERWAMAVGVGPAVATAQTPEDAGQGLVGQVPYDEDMALDHGHGD